jgi:hypothetical protein
VQVLLGKKKHTHTHTKEKEKKRKEKKRVSRRAISAGHRVQEHNPSCYKIKVALM